MVRDDLPLLKEQFRQLHYLTGDSALCTGKILKEAVAKGLEVVTRVPDKCTIAKRCINETEYSELKSIDPEDPTCLTKAKWCGDAEIDGVKIKLLLVNNEAMRSKKEVTVRKHADKEKEELESKLKKLATNPCKCQADAEKCIQELQKKLKFCRLSDISYEKVLKHSSRGRPSKNDSKVVAAVKASATVTINEEILSQKVENELRYVIATIDLKRNWTAAELISVYKK